MAKMKTFAVEVEITVKRTIFVEARRPNGAVEALQTREGWAQATAYTDDPVLEGYFEAPKDMVVTQVRAI